MAAENRYTRPQFSADGEMRIAAGRHPVIEKLAGEEAGRFIPNDLYLNDAADQIAIITGPNMGGKSTYLRQAALIAILAQMGSWVPADAALLPLIDRIFTRIGASDNLARGRSTFMVEMTETAVILNTATPRSFIILDEIGRGTATYDGLSLAWAVVEHIATHTRAKTLFATHYHELTELAEQLAGRAQSARRGQRSRRPHHFPAQSRARQGRSQLRDRSRAPGRPARRRDRTRPRSAPLHERPSIARSSDCRRIRNPPPCRFASSSLARTRSSRRSAR